MAAARPRTFTFGLRCGAQPTDCDARGEGTVAILLKFHDSSAFGAEDCRVGGRNTTRTRNAVNYARLQYEHF